jgi:hypothetical protein
MNLAWLLFRQQPTKDCHTYMYVYTDTVQYRNSYFGIHPYPSSIYFNCFGNESMLSNCQSPSLSSSCGSDDIAGVHCKGDVITGIVSTQWHDMQVCSRAPYAIPIVLNNG